MKTLSNLWILSRPHAMKAHLLAVFIMFALAFMDNSKTLLLTNFSMFILLLKVFVSSAALNIYTQAINQLFDLNIDKINKPFLPYASGQFSIQKMILIIVLSTLITFVFAMLVNVIFCITISLAFLLATIYSMPPLRVKQYPFGPVFIITVGRGIIFHNGLYLTYQLGLNGSYGQIPIHILLLTTFLSVFSVVISVSKDIPDVIGDKAYGIRSLSVQLTPNTMFNFVKMTITGMYIVWTGAYWYFLNGKQYQYINLWIITILHIIMLMYFWYKTKYVVAVKKDIFLRFYEGPFWNLFYVEFIGFFVACIIKF